MKKPLVALFVALLMVGCGEDEKSGSALQVFLWGFFVGNAATQAMIG